jgi:PAS domain S-box-containing protein
MTDDTRFYRVFPEYIILDIRPRSLCTMLKRNVFSPVGITLAILFVSMLGIMFVFELAKQLISPAISLWESHVITIIFTSIVAVVIVFFPLRSTWREQLKAEDSLRQRLEAEEKLRMSEVQYRSFVESVEDSIYTVDPDLRYLLINTRHLARRGLSPEMYAGRKYEDFHSPEESAVFAAQVHRVLASKAPVQDEYEQQGRYYLRKLNPVVDPAVNTVIAVTVVSADITDRKRAEKNLESINRKLNLMNDITRHDMLNQLTVLNSYLALAAEQAGDLAILKYLAKGEQAIDTIHAQILFARDYQKIGVESPQWQDISVTIRKASQLLKVPSLTIDERCAGTEIYADPLLEKVFYNLLDNAVRYAGPEVAIRFSLKNDAGRLVLVCEDNGPGVPPENKEKIFLREFGKNTGLGLFLIREILSMTGIAIRENGEPGKGTRFGIVVPAGKFRAAEGK